MPINPGTVGSGHSLGNVRLNWIIGHLIAPHSETRNCLVRKKLPSGVRVWSVPGKVRGAERAQRGRPSPARQKAMLVFPVFSISGILFLFSFLIHFFFWMGKYRHVLAHLNRPLRRSLPLPATRGSWFYSFLPCPSGAFSWFASYSQWNTA